MKKILQKRIIMPALLFFSAVLFADCPDSDENLISDLKTKGESIVLAEVDSAGQLTWCVQAPKSRSKKRFARKDIGIVIDKRNRLYITHPLSIQKRDYWFGLHYRAANQVVDAAWLAKKITQVKSKDYQIKITNTGCTSSKWGFEKCGFKINYVALETAIKESPVIPDIDENEPETQNNNDEDTNNNSGFPVRNSFTETNDVFTNNKDSENEPPSFNDDEAENAFNWLLLIIPVALFFIVVTIVLIVKGKKDNLGSERINRNEPSFDSTEQSFLEKQKNKAREKKQPTAPPAFTAYDDNEEPIESEFIELRDGEEDWLNDLKPKDGTDSKDSADDWLNELKPKN